MISKLAASHANAMFQLNVPDSEDEAHADASASPLGDDKVNSGNSDDSEHVFTKMQNLPEAAGAEDADMQQAAIKRPMLPPLDIPASSSTEDIMCKLHELKCAKKFKLTPRGGSSDE